MPRSVHSFDSSDFHCVWPLITFILYDLSHMTCSCKKFQSQPQLLSGGGGGGGASLHPRQKPVTPPPASCKMWFEGWLSAKTPYVGVGDLEASRAIQQRPMWFLVEVLGCVMDVVSCKEIPHCASG